jgi:ceramide glucosyltransferase
MLHWLAISIAILTTTLTMCALGYYLAVLVAARVFLAGRRRSQTGFAPAVSVLKPLKGLDPGMLEAFRSHCQQQYAGPFELIFGVASEDDPAAGAVRQLAAEFPQIPIRLVICPARLGTSGKVSSLCQMLPAARHPYILINDSDILVGPHYLARVMAGFAPEDGSKPVGMVTALYRGRAHRTLGSRLEAMTILEFISGVLLSRLIEGGLSYGLGSTLAVSREALDKSGGLKPLLNELADDYQLGLRIHRAGYRVALGPEVVETAIPAYGWREYVDHQLRWMRTVRDSRPAGYAGLVFTQGLALALVNVAVCQASSLSLGLLGAGLILRLAAASVVGTAVLDDAATLPWLWLMPLRDLVAAGLWLTGLAGNTIVWRGERYRLKNGRLHPL